MRTSNRALALALVAICGCAPTTDRVPVFPAGGTVTHDGRPAAGALVILHPTDPAAAPVKPRGKVGPDGAFRLTTYESGDGAPAGAYAVTVYWPKPPPAGQPNGDDGPDLLNGKYMRPNAPAARATVRPDADNTFPPITLK